MKNHKNQTFHKVSFSEPQQKLFLFVGLFVGLIVWDLWHITLCRLFNDNPFNSNKLFQII